MAHGEGHDPCMAHESAHERAADIRKYAADARKVWLTERFYNSWRRPMRDAHGAREDWMDRRMDAQTVGSMERQLERCWL